MVAKVTPHVFRIWGPSRITTYLWRGMLYFQTPSLCHKSVIQTSNHKCVASMLTQTGRNGPVLQPIDREGKELEGKVG